MLLPKAAFSCCPEARISVGLLPLPVKNGSLCLTGKQQHGSYRTPALYRKYGFCFIIFLNLREGRRERERRDREIQKFSWSGSFPKCPQCPDGQDEAGPELGVQSRSGMWVAGTQLTEPSSPPPRIYTGKRSQEPEWGMKPGHATMACDLPNPEATCMGV